MPVYPRLEVNHPFLFATLAVPSPFLLPKFPDAADHLRIVPASGSENRSADVEHACNGDTVVSRFAQEADVAVLKVKPQAVEVLVGITAEGE